MQLIDINQLDSAYGYYGTLIPGKKKKIPVVLASTVCRYPETTKGTVFFDTMCTDGKTPVNDSMAPHIATTVPSRTTDGGGDRDSWSRREEKFRESGHVFLANTRCAITNAWFHKSGRKDESPTTHVRDHVWNVHLHGTLCQHFNTEANRRLMLEHDQEFRYDFDYLWRIPRRAGDIKRVPLLAAEVESMHLDAKVTKSNDSNNDYMVLRVPVEEGFLRFGIKYPLSSICYTDACSMDASMASFYGAENMTTTVLNKITMTAIVYALQQYHGLSRKAAFEFVGVQIYDVYPVMKEGFYTFDDAHERPWMVNGDHIWERNRYRLYGEPLFDGTASTADIKRFTKLYGSTMEYLRDVQAMFTIDKPLEDNFWWGGESYAPNWRTTTKTCALLCHFLYNQDDVDWDHDPLHGEKGLSDCDWGLRWINWSQSRNNRTDFVLLQRLGVIPFLPRITPDYKQAKNWEWLATARRRLYPACVVVWDKLEKQLEKQTAEIAKLSEMIGEPIDPKWLKKALEYDVLRSGRPDTAVFLLGAMEITALKREDAEKQLREELGPPCYVSLD